jgi:hypothetical protein
MWNPAFARSIEPPVGQGPRSQRDAAVSFQDAQGLDLSREELCLSRAELFIRYFALGGAVERRRIDAFLDGRTEGLARVEYDMLVHALNEGFSDLGLDHPVPYSRR